MEIKDFISNFIDQFDDEPEEELNENTVFRELDGWSSIVALSVMAMVDEEYDVQIKADEMRHANTIGDIFRIVRTQRGE